MLLESKNEVVHNVNGCKELELRICNHALNIILGENPDLALSKRLDKETKSYNVPDDNSDVI